MEADRQAEILHTLGPCPICFDSGDLISLADARDKKLLVWCPLCEGAWRSREASHTQDVESLAALAPEGVDVPSKSALARAGWGTAVPATESLVLWREVLEPFRRRRGSA